MKPSCICVTDSIPVWNCPDHGFEAGKGSDNGTVWTPLPEGTVIEEAENLTETPEDTVRRLASEVLQEKANVKDRDIKIEVLQKLIEELEIRVTNFRQSAYRRRETVEEQKETLKAVNERLKATEKIVIALLGVAERAAVGLNSAVLSVKANAAVKAICVCTGVNGVHAKNPVCPRHGGK